MEQRAFATFIGMFSPTRSPFYAVVVAGLVALGFMIRMDLEWVDVRFVAYPVIPLICVFSLAAFFHKVMFTPEAHNYQLVYARTIGLIAFIASIVVLVSQRPNFEEVPLCIVPGGHEFPPRLCDALTSFDTLYIQCAIAGAMFLSLSVIRASHVPREKVVNFTQIALILSALLGSGVFFASLAAGMDGSDIAELAPEDIYPNIALLFAGVSLGMWWIIMAMAIIFLAVSTAIGMTTLTVAAPDEA